VPPNVCGSPAAVSQVFQTSLTSEGRRRVSRVLGVGSLLLRAPELRAQLAALIKEQPGHCPSGGVVQNARVTSRALAYACDMRRAQALATARIHVGTSCQRSNR
jgi:hypothetical protein